MITKADFPKQPEIVRAYFARQNRDLNGLFAGALSDGPEATADFIKGIFDIPAEVSRAYTEWANEYNKIVKAYNAQIQAAKNAREVAKIRSAACPVCFATHPGEC